MSTRIAVLGAGAWGTALAASFARAGQDCLLWGRGAQTVAAINERQRNPNYLGDIALPADLKATTDAGAALAGAQTIVLAVPAQTLRAFLADNLAKTEPHSLFVSTAKGIDRESGRTMSEIIDDIAGPERSAVLSGPSFAADVAAGLPTAVTVAAHDLGVAKALAETLSSRTLRCYASDDLMGVELGGALKNVLAIAAGIVHGFVKTRPELETPDVQLQFFPGTYRSIRDRTLDREPGATLGPTLLRVESRGSVHAASPDPLAPPAILTNVLGTDRDRESALLAMRFTRRLMETAAMRPYYDHEITPGVDVQSDADMLAYAREMGASNWHPASSCRMGPDGDPKAVVDTSLRVRGLGALRVVDASVMPSVVSGNTNAPTIMIAEKAADMILAD